MSDTLTRYRNVEYALPETYLSWDLFGAGLDNLGRDGKPVELPLRDPKADEVLLRVDALGLCFSDTKLIWAGNEHPRIRGRDLQTDPTVAGHEAALTVVKVGDDWKSRFEVGQRFIIQADVYINGEQKAYGYVQRGAMAQYTYVGPWVLDGDAGCYLLPLQDATGYAEAALVEPWACVEAAYHIEQRSHPKAGGRLLLVFAEDLHVDLSGMYEGASEPGFGVVLGKTQIDLTPVIGAAGMVKTAPPQAAAVAALVTQETEDQGFDDIVIVGQADADLITACDAALAQGGILAFVGPQAPTPALIDIGRVHYHGTRHVGTQTGFVMDAYQANDRQDLKPEGATWMIGAAGPMGQMHVQRAIELENPPACILATDIAAERLNYMNDRLANLAQKRGVKLVCLDVSDAAVLEPAIAECTEGRGFDDVYVHAPVAPLVEQAAKYVGMNAVLNIFAGVGLGTMATLPPAAFMEQHARVIGSSGSSMNDIQGVLEKCESGRLATRMSLAALGGIETTWEGIKGVKEGRFPGKTVIFPQLQGLPLMGPEVLADTCPAASQKLESGSIWTNAAEEALLESMLKL